MRRGIRRSSRRVLVEVVLLFGEGRMREGRTAMSALPCVVRVLRSSVATVSEYSAAFSVFSSYFCRLVIDLAQK